MTKILLPLDQADKVFTIIVVVLLATWIAVVAYSFRRPKETK